MHQNGIALPGQPVEMPVMNLVQPLNDTQMICLMAPHCPGMSPEAQVDYATSIVYAAMRKMSAYAEQCKAIVNDLKKAKEAE